VLTAPTCTKNVTACGCPPVADGTSLKLETIALIPFSGEDRAAAAASVVDFSFPSSSRPRRRAAAVGVALDTAVDDDETAVGAPPLGPTMGGRNDVKSK
jgi:hypothetical protein